MDDAAVRAMMELHNISWSLAPARMRQELQEKGGAAVSEKRLKRMKREHEDAVRSTSTVAANTIRMKREHEDAVRSTSQAVDEEDERMTASELLELLAINSEELLEAQDYDAAAREADQALHCLPFMQRAALARGRARLHPALTRMVDHDELPSKRTLDEVHAALQIARRLDPRCEETKKELDRLAVTIETVQQLTEKRNGNVEAGGAKTEIMDRASPVAMPAAGRSTADAAASLDFDVIIVGAGAAGIGCALMLTQTFGLDASRVLLIERGAAIGETFRRWPAEIRFISPSFNQQGSSSTRRVAHSYTPGLPALLQLPYSYLPATHLLLTLSAPLESPTLVRVDQFL